MLFYFGLLVCAVVLAAFTAYKKPESGRKRNVIVPFALLFVVLAFRDISVGVDTAAYERLFLKIARQPDWINAVSNAPVYTTFAKVISLLGGNYRVLMILTALVSLYAVARFIQAFSLNTAVSIYCFITLYFYFFAFNGARQFLAIALVLLGICARKNRRWPLAVLLALLSVGTHSTALVAVPFLLFSPEKFSKRMLRNVLLASALFAVVFNVLFERIIQWFVFLFPRYEWYLGENIRSVFDQSQGDIIYLNVFYLLVVIGSVVVIYAKRFAPAADGPEQNHLRYFTALLAVGAALGLAGGSYLSIARIAYYFQIHVICLIPNILEHSGRYKALLCAAACLVLLVPFVISLLRNFNGIIPYAMGLSG